MKNIKEYNLDELKQELISLGEKGYRADQKTEFKKENSSVINSNVYVLSSTSISFSASWFFLFFKKTYTAEPAIRNMN